MSSSSSVSNKDLPECVDNEHPVIRVRVRDTEFVIQTLTSQSTALELRRKIYQLQRTDQWPSQARRSTFFTDGDLFMISLDGEYPRTPVPYTLRMGESTGCFSFDNRMLAGLEFLPYAPFIDFERSLAFGAVVDPKNPNLNILLQRSWRGDSPVPHAYAALSFIHWGDDQNNWPGSWESPAPPTLMTEEEIKQWPNEQSTQQPQQPEPSRSTTSSSSSSSSPLYGFTPDERSKREKEVFHAENNPDAYRLQLWKVMAMQRACVIELREDLAELVRSNQKEAFYTALDRIRYIGGFNYYGGDVRSIQALLSKTAKHPVSGIVFDGTIRGSSEDLHQTVLLTPKYHPSAFPGFHPNKVYALVLRHCARRNLLEKQSVFLQSIVLKAFRWKGMVFETHLEEIGANRDMLPRETWEDFVIPFITSDT